MSHLFSEFTLHSPRGPLKLPNRVIVAPMCQYSAHEGQATDWHLMHWGNLLNSGAAMFFIEATAVTPKGRITPTCLGLWDEATAAALHDKLGRARHLAPKVPVCMQLAHIQFASLSDSCSLVAGGRLTHLKLFDKVVHDSR